MCITDDNVIISTIPLISHNINIIRTIRSKPESPINRSLTAAADATYKRQHYTFTVICTNSRWYHYTRQIQIITTRPYG